MGAPEVAIGVPRLDLGRAPADEFGQMPLRLLDVPELQLVHGAHLVGVRVSVRARGRGRGRVRVRSWGLGFGAWGLGLGA